MILHWCIQETRSWLPVLRQTAACVGEMMLWWRNGQNWTRFALVTVTRSRDLCSLCSARSARDLWCTYALERVSSHFRPVLGSTYPVLFIGLKLHNVKYFLIRLLYTVDLAARLKWRSAVNKPRSPGQYAEYRLDDRGSITARGKGIQTGRPGFDHRQRKRNTDWTTGVRSPSEEKEFRLDDRGSITGRGKGFLLQSLCPDQLWGPPSLLYNGYQGSFPGVKRGRSVTLTTHPNVVPRSRMRIIHLISLLAPAFSSGTTLLIL
jgi:hypothetical protein